MNYRFGAIVDVGYALWRGVTYPMRYAVEQAHILVQGSGKFGFNP